MKKKGSIEMEDIKTDHPLFQELKKNPPLWWNNLKSDPELYIDVRKDNYLNVYHNGGSIMKLSWTKNYKAEIHPEYIPLHSNSDNINFEFQNENILLKDHKIVEIKNFEKSSLEKIKKRIKKFFPNNSEKGMQGQYVINNNFNSRNSDGFFIDTEFMFDNKRIDMVWIDFEYQKIALVELKTINDERLYIHKNSNKETIDKQLNRYYELAHKNGDALVRYYDRVYSIKKELGILSKFAKEKSLEEYKLIEKPILLIGDCTKEWIKNNADELNLYINKIAFGCLYHGKTTYNFKVPYSNSRNCFSFNGA